MKVYRQGDVLLIECPEDLREKIVAGNRIKFLSKKLWCRTKTKELVLAIGETTGHSHKIKSENIYLWNSNDLPNKIEKFVIPNAINPDGYSLYLMEIKKSCELEHEEHDTIVIPPGFYEISRQREYVDENNTLLVRD